MPSVSEPVIRAVVFDLDGLMLNTEDVFDLAGRELLARRHLEMTESIRDAMMGRRAHEAFQAMKDLTGIPDTIPDLMQETKTLFKEIARHQLDTMPGLLSLLDTIEQRQLPKGVATSSPREYMTALLGHFQLLPRFAMTLAAEDVTHGKPHPEIYLTAAQRLNVSTAEMLVLEDSEVGTTAAAAAGAVVISVPNRHTRHQNFDAAHRRVDSLAAPEIRHLLK